MPLTEEGGARREVDGRERWRTSSSTAWSRAACRARSRPRGSSRRSASPRRGLTFRELEGGRLEDVADPETAFVNAFSGVAAGGRRRSSAARRSARCSTAPSRRCSVSRAEPGWDVALVVAHGGTIRALLSFALTGGRAFLGNFELAPASFSILDVGEDWIVRAVNVTPYDLAHTRTRLRTMEELWDQYKSMSSTTQSSS